MTQSKLHTVINSLKKEEDRLLEEQKRLRAEAQGINAELRRLRSASRALEKSVGDTEQKTPAPPQAVVTQILSAVKKAFPDADENATRKTVAGQLKKSGYSLVGFGLRYKQASRAHNDAKADGSMPPGADDNSDFTR